MALKDLFELKSWFRHTIHCAFCLAEGREWIDKTLRRCKLAKAQSAMATAKEVGPDGCVIWIDDELKEWKKRNDGDVADFLERKKPPADEDAGIFSRLNTVLLSRYGLTKEHIAFVDSILASPELSRSKLVLNMEEGPR